jgi:hypothetical protein
VPASLFVYSSLFFTFLVCLSLFLLRFYASNTIVLLSVLVLQMAFPPDPSLFTGRTGSTRIVHFRSVADGVTQADLIGLASPYGPVSNLVMMRSKKQALLEFQNVSDAQRFMAAAPPSGILVGCEFISFVIVPV